MISELAILVQKNQLMLNEEEEAVPALEEAQKEFEEELDEVIEAIDEFEENNNTQLESPPHEINFSKTFENSSIIRKFSEVMDDVPKRLTKSNSISYSPSRFVEPKVNSKSKDDSSVVYVEHQKSLDEIVSMYQMQKPKSTDGGKTIFIRSHALSTNHESDTAFVVVNSEQRMKANDEPVLDEIMQEESVIGSMNQVFNCDTYSSGSSKYYLGLIDSMIPIKRRVRSENTSESQKNSNSDNRENKRSVLEVISESFDARNLDIRVIFDSKVSKDIAEALKQKKPILKKVNNFNLNVPLNLHRKHEVFHWILKTYEVIMKNYPDAHVIVYSDFSMFFEVPGMSTKEALKGIKKEVKEQTERDGLITLEQKGDHATLLMKVGEMSVPLGNIVYEPDNHIDTLKRQRRLRRLRR